MIATSLVELPPPAFVLVVLALGFGTHYVSNRVGGEVMPVLVLVTSMVLLAGWAAEWVLWGHLTGGTFDWWQSRLIILFSYFLPFHLLRSNT